ncbi:MAG: DUF6326 family protein [Pseudomonadota bacterium]
MLKSKTTESFGNTISLLWLFAILNVLFRDIHELTTASAINEILSGTVNGNPVTEEVLFAAAFAVELLLLAFLFSSLLSPRAARMMNLFLAPLAIIGTVFGAPGDPDDYFFAVVTTLTYAAIFILCWTWKPQKTSDLTGRVQHVS